LTTAYANPSHHNIPKYSFVAVEGENDEGLIETWYGRIISFLEFDINSNKENFGATFIFSILLIFDFIRKFNFKYFSDTHQVAYIEYMKYSGRTDKETDCEKFCWETIGKRYKLAHLNNLIRVVHVLPIFKKDSEKVVEEFLLNRFEFK